VGTSTSESLLLLQRAAISSTDTRQPLYAVLFPTLPFAVYALARDTISLMAPNEQPFTPPDDALLPAYAHHYIIKAVCTCGHEREIYARPIQRQ
jgi:hypothetical protein